MFKKFICIFFSLLLISFFAGGFLNNSVQIKETDFLMDTTVEITIYGQQYQKAALGSYLDNTFKIIKEVDDHSTSYIDYEDNIFSLNNHQGAFYKVNEDVINQLNHSIPFYEMTGGEFDIGLFRTINLWKEAEKSNILPSPQEAKATLSESTPQDIIIHQDSREVFLPLDMKIDLGAISKGYSLDEAYKYLKTTKAKGALINAGGNIMAYGHPDNREFFKIAVQDPMDPQGVIGTIELYKGQAVSTSGSYNRFFTINGNKYSHIISGTTGYPAKYHKSVTVITDKGINSDIMSTVLFLLPVEDGLDLIKGLNFKVEAMYITDNDEIIKTEGFPITYEKNIRYTYQ